MSRVIRAGGMIGAVLVGLALAISATGIFYALRGLSVPGPVVRDALPLDELPRHDAVPLLLFVAVWTPLALLIASMARAFRAERLTGAVLLALGVWGWTYASVGVSLLVVRQIPAHDAFRIAAQLRAVYLPGVIAGLAAAFLGRSKETARPRAPLLLAALVAATGAISVLDGILPARPHTLLAELSLARVTPVASALVAPLGLALLVVARGLARRKRRAYHVALALLIGLAILHEAHRFDYGAVAAALVAVLLVARRNVFDAPGDPSASPRLALRATALLAAIYAYGAVVLWINRVEADQPFTLRFALAETTRALSGLDLGGSAHLVDGFGSWFPISVFAAGLAAAVLAPRVLARAVALQARAGVEGTGARPLRRRRYGADTLAPFSLRADKSYFFSGSDRAFVAYRVVNGVAIVSGDPIGPPEEIGELIERFVRFARSATGASPSSAPPSGCSTSTRTTGCRRSTTGTRPFSTWPRSRSTGGRSARCGSRSTGCAAPATGRRCYIPARSRPSCARSSRRSRARGAAPSRARLRDGARRSLPARGRGRRVRRRT